MKATEDVMLRFRKREDAHVVYPVSVPPISALYRDGDRTLVTAVSGS